MSPTLEQTFFETLNEKQKRLFAGLKANELGYFGVTEIAERFAIHPQTVRAGQKELAAIAATGETSARIRRVGGGREKNLRATRASVICLIKSLRHKRLAVR